VWEERPLQPELLHYAAADVRYLHLLDDALRKLLPPTIVQKVGVAEFSAKANLKS
jgi:ribonuclease D